MEIKKKLFYLKFLKNAMKKVGWLRNFRVTLDLIILLPVIRHYIMFYGKKMFFRAIQVYFEFKISIVFDNSIRFYFV